MSLGQFGKQLRAYRQYLRDSRTDLTPLLAFTGVLLVLGDRALLWLLGWIAPDVATRASAWPLNDRVLCIGLPLAATFLMAAIGSHWRRMRKQLAPDAREYSRTLEESETQPILDALATIAASVPQIPFEYSLERMRELPEWPGRFDPQRWFQAFRQVRPKPDHVLDFVYSYWGNGGEPLLYLRHENAVRLRTREEYWSRFGGGLSSATHAGNCALATDLVWDLTPVGVFEYLMFWLMAPRFHRHWHSASGQFDVVSGSTDLERRVSRIRERATNAFPFPDGGATGEQLAMLRALDARPQVSIDPLRRSASVRLLLHASGEAFVWVRYAMRVGQPPWEAERSDVLRYGLAPKS